jgi:hypothetical protein
MDRFRVGGVVVSEIVDEVVCMKRGGQDVGTGGDGDDNFVVI